MKYIVYIFFRFLVFLFSLVPFPVLYFISDILRFLLNHILRYRSQVIKKNIEYCFPELSANKRRLIYNDFYKNFVDVILESIKGLSSDPVKLQNRYVLKNPEILTEHYKNNQSVIIFSQHYNNWEWGSITLGLQTSHHIIGIIKTISNGYINQYMKEGRTGNNVSVCAAEDTSKLFKAHDGVTKGIVFIADQMPYRKGKHYNIEFFGRSTDFHKGGAIFACAANYPAFSIDIHRVARGRYALELIELHPSPIEIGPESLTSLYVQNLERLIRHNPSNWLWSHKRFKKVIEY